MYVRQTRELATSMSTYSTVQYTSYATLHYATLRYATLQYTVRSCDPPGAIRPPGASARGEAPHACTTAIGGHAITGILTSVIYQFTIIINDLTMVDK